jgi:hypothetical protein
MSLTRLIKDAISLTSDVERLAKEVSSVSKAMREVEEKQTEKIHALDKRVMRLETMLEFAEKFTAPKLEKN